MYQAIESQISQAWQSSNIFKLGIVLILLLAVLYPAQYIQETVSSMSEQLQEQQQKLAKLKSISRETRWEERARQARSQTIQLQGKLRIAQSKSLSHASIQSVVNNKLRQHDIKNINVKINTSPVTDIQQSKIWQVSVRLSGRLDIYKLLELIKVLETDDKYLHIERLSINKQRFELQFFTYVLKPDTPDSETPDSETPDLETPDSEVLVQ